MLDYVIFAQLMFYALTVGAVFVLRVKHPDARRPYRAWGYPWVTAAYIVAAVAMMADLLVMKPHYTWPGLLIALSGIPLYWLTRLPPPAYGQSILTHVELDKAADGAYDRDR